jgi:hypothetical protein
LNLLVIVSVSTLIGTSIVAPVSAGALCDVLEQIQTLEKSADVLEQSLFSPIAQEAWHQVDKDMRDVDRIFLEIGAIKFTWEETPVRGYIASRRMLLYIYKNSGPGRAQKFISSGSYDQYASKIDQMYSELECNIERSEPGPQQSASAPPQVKKV